MTNSNEQVDSIDTWSTALADPAVRESMTNLLNRLPELEKGINSLEKVVDFGHSLLEDEPFINEVENKLAIHQLDMATLSSLLVLMEKLPSLVSTINQLEGSLAFAAAISKDPESIDYLTQQVRGYAEPVIEEGKKGMAFVATVKNKAEQDQKKYSIFSIFKWLKDPAVQTGFRYINATLVTLNEKKTK